MEADGTAISWDSECLAVNPDDWALTAVLAVIVGSLLGAALVIVAFC